MAAGLTVLLSGGGEQTSETGEPVLDETKVEAIEIEEKSEADVKAEEEAKAKAEAEAKANAETVSQQQAVGMAENYLEFTAFSKNGLIEQLEFEGFSNADATYAVDTVGL